MIHYHICWSNGKVDWEKFSIPQDARVEAERLAAPNETFVIEPFFDDCPQCKVIAELAEWDAKRRSHV